MTSIENKELHSTPSDAREKLNQLNHWKIAFKKGSESTLDHRENSKASQSCAPRLNIYQQRMAKHSEKEDTRDTKRKRTRDDDTTPRDLKVHHRDSSFGSSDGDGRSNVSRDSPRRNKFRKKPVEIEHDKAILARRQKQIDYGKNTVGYDRYCRLVPKDKRQRSHPSTPPKHIKYSRRGWDGLIKIWRQKLHSWDPPQDENMIDDLRDSPTTIKVEEGSKDEETSVTSMETEELRDLPTRIKLEMDSEEEETSVKIEGGTEEDLCIKKEN